MELMHKNMQSKNVDNTKRNGKKPRGGRSASAINTASRGCPCYQVDLNLSSLNVRLLLQHRKSHSRANPEGWSPYCDTKPRHVPPPALVLRPPPVELLGSQVAQARPGRRWPWRTVLPPSWQALPRGACAEDLPFRVGGSELGLPGASGPG